MEFTERRYSVLLVSSSPKFNESMLALLPGEPLLSGHRCIRRFQCPAAPSRKQIRHSHNQRPATRRFRHPPCPQYMRKQRRRRCSLFVKAEHYPDINGRVSPFGVLVLPKPASSQTVSQSLQLLCGTRERLRRMEQKTASIEEKMEEIRIINRAKLLLMEQLKMTEKEAHRFIEKQAMDRCVTRITIAQSILSTYK